MFGWLRLVSWSRADPPAPRAAPLGPLLLLTLYPPQPGAPLRTASSTPGLGAPLCTLCAALCWPRALGETVGARTAALNVNCPCQESTCSGFLGFHTWWPPCSSTWLWPVAQEPVVKTVTFAFSTCAKRKSQPHGLDRRRTSGFLGGGWL